jgi:hypothetical protein
MQFEKLHHRQTFIEAMNLESKLHHDPGRSTLAVPLQLRSRQAKP